MKGGVSMKRTVALVLALLLALSAVSALAAAGKIAINSKNFPDPVFRAYIQEQFDSDKDNALTQAERDKVTTISIHGGDLQDVTGIKHFAKLKILSITDTQLSSLDTSANRKLTSLECEANQLSSLNVKKNTKLKYLLCGSNKLTKLTIGTNSNMFQ